MSSALLAYVSAPPELHLIRKKVGGGLHALCNGLGVVHLVWCLGDEWRVVVGGCRGMNGGLMAGGGHSRTDSVRAHVKLRHRVKRLLPELANAKMCFYATTSIR